MVRGYKQAFEVLTGVRNHAKRREAELGTPYWIQGRHPGRFQFSAACVDENLIEHGQKFAVGINRGVQRIQLVEILPDDPPPPPENYIVLAKTGPVTPEKNSRLYFSAVPLYESVMGSQPFTSTAVIEQVEGRTVITFEYRAARGYRHE